ncbi:MAG: beta-N-acetylhexosaminidase [Bryobacterales bacterium]|nr:beta-N-acetylhexosaminidase [Bryobacterales bacterium]
MRSLLGSIVLPAFRRPFRGWRELLTLASFALLCPAPGLAAGAGADLLPQPRMWTQEPGFLRIHNGFRTFHRGPADPFVDQLLERFTNQLAHRTGIRFPAPRATEDYTALLRVETRSATPDYPHYGVDEAYQLEVSAGHITLRATHGYGLRHGLQTLLQLLETRTEGQGFAAIRIDDAPRFGWRGLQIDPVRHFLPIPLVKRQLDAMEAMKLNVLHILFSNDQAFRMESKRYPKLHQMGAEGQYYTQQEMRDLVEYARLRGIRVIPDFGVPTHIASWLVGYPELGARPGPYSLIRSFGIFHPTFDPTREETYQFLGNLFAEMATLFPDQYIHIGGDELTGKPWRENPDIQAFMRTRGMAEVQDLQVYFTRRVLSLVEAQGKRAIGWDEILHPELPPTILVQSWQGQKALAASVRRGNAGILSAGYYLDLMLPAEEHYGVDPLGGAGADLNAQEAARVYGGEACSWAEFITAENLELKLWPRLAAIAERLWSPADVTSVDALYRRLPKVLDELEWLDVSPRQVQRRMLRRALPAGTSMEAMLAWLTVFEPVKRYLRADSGEYTVFRPLNRFVDLLWPESLEARRFRLRVEAWMRSPQPSPALSSEVRNALLVWRAHHAGAVAALQSSSLLADGVDVAIEADETAALGLEALGWMEAGRIPPSAWVDAARARLDRWRSQRREVLNLLVEPVTLLVETAASPGTHSAPRVDAR